MHLALMYFAVMHRRKCVHCMIVFRNVVWCSLEYVARICAHRSDGDCSRNYVRWRRYRRRILRYHVFTTAFAAFRIGRASSIRTLCVQIIIFVQKVWEEGSGNSIGGDCAWSRLLQDLRRFATWRIDRRNRGDGRQCWSVRFWCLKSLTKYADWLMISTGRIRKLMWCRID